MKPLAFSLSKNIKDKGLSHKLHAALIADFLSELLKQDFTQDQLATLESIAYKNKQCIIRAGSPALKQEIKLRQMGYLERVNQHFGPKTAEKITFS